MSISGGTIAAISTAAADSAVGMVRISGENALQIADSIFASKSGSRLFEKKGYTALFGSVFDADGEFDTAVALVFRAPKSYTGEDVVEITVHGGYYITRRLLRAAVSAGARQAQAGEFTKRAFLNSKMTLSQAEAVTALISAKGREQAQAALAASGGEIDRRSAQIREKIVVLLGQIAAYCDYPDEDIVDVSRETLEKQLDEIKQILDKMIDSFDKGRVVSQGIDTAIVGSPNVGKSTIMNLLSGCNKSIVTDVAGTTRDVVEETVRVGDFVLRLCDTAGIHDTGDTVEAAGVEKAKKRLESAALVIAVFDYSRSLSDEDFSVIASLNGKNAVAVINKNDLPQKIDQGVVRSAFDRAVCISAVNSLAAKQLEGLICSALEQFRLSADATGLINERQYDCAVRARREIDEAIGELSQGQLADMIGINLQQALDSLSELSGENATEAVVNEIFSKFCVGK